MLRRSVVSLVLALFVAVSWWAPPAQAVFEEGDNCHWSYNGNGYLYVYWRYGSETTGAWAEYGNAYFNAAYTWTHTPTAIVMSSSSSGSVVVTSRYDPTDWRPAGMNSTPPCIAPGTLRGATTYINRYVRYSENWSAHTLQYMACHELGHALGLAHVVDSRPAVMANHRDNTEVYYAPQAPDIEDLNFWY